MLTPVRKLKLTDGSTTVEDVRQLTLDGGTVTDGGAGAATITVTGGGGGAPTTASYLTLGTNATLTNERVLTAGADITLTDAGAGSTLTVGVTADTYQPLDADLTAIAGLTTTSFGRGLLTETSAATARETLVVGRVDSSLYVDLANGNDSTGTRERADLPYLTLAAAKAAATSGDTIYVRPGAYTCSASLAKNGVNWHFAAGASVTFASDVSTVGIWDDGGTAMVFAVTGDGDFTRSTADEFLGFKLVNCSHASSVMSIRGRDFTSTGSTDGTCSVFWQDAGELYFEARNITQTGGNSYAVWWSNGAGYGRCAKCESEYIAYSSSVNATPTGDGHFAADEIIGQVASGGSDTTAAAWVRCNILRAAGISVSSSGGARLYVEAQKIFGRLELSGGLVYVRSDKLSAVANGGATTPSLIYAVAGGTGTYRVDVTHLDPVSYTGETIVAAGGTLEVIGGSLVGGASAKGIVVSGGTATFIGTRIDTAANSSANPVTKSGGTLTLKDCTLVAEGTRNSIEAATAQTVAVGGTLTANRPLDADVTLTGGLYVRSDTGAVTASVFNGSGAGLTSIPQSAVTNLSTDLSGKLAAASNLSDLASASTARTNLGLGTMAVQSSGAVTVTGGSVTGLSALSVIDQSGLGTFKVGIAFDQNEAADRTLSIRLGGADRRLTLTGNPSLSAITTTGTGTIATGSNTLTVAGTASVSGTNTGDQSSVTGNAGTATALATARAFSIAGSTGLTASGVNFDGTGVVALSLTGTLVAGNGGTGATSLGGASAVESNVFKPRGPLTATTANGATTIPLATSNRHVLTLTASATLSLTGDADGDSWTLFVRGQASGYTLTWWSGIKWTGGAAPTIPTTSGRVMPISFTRLASGEYLGIPGTECY